MGRRKSAAAKRSVEREIGGGGGGSRTRVRKLMMPCDFWPKALNHKRLEIVIQSTAVLPCARQSTSVVETFWRRGRGVLKRRGAPDSTNLIVVLDFVPL